MNRMMNCAELYCPLVDGHVKGKEKNNLAEMTPKKYVF